MIIDCHGHYTTAPPALEAWRNRQIAGLADPAVAPRAADLAIGTELELTTMPLYTDDDGIERVTYAWRIA